MWVTGTWPEFLMITLNLASSPTKCRKGACFKTSSVPAPPGLGAAAGFGRSNRCGWGDGGDATAFCGRVAGVGAHRDCVALLAGGGDFERERDRGRLAWAEVFHAGVFHGVFIRLGLGVFQPMVELVENLDLVRRAGATVGDDGRRTGRSRRR